MEFDLETFMFEVTTGFDKSSPPPPLTRPSPPAHTTTEDRELSGSEVEDSSREEYTSSRVKRRRLSKSPHIVAKDAPQNVQSMGIPSFFHPSVYPLSHI